jgi:hypothetical protein
MGSIRSLAFIANFLLSLVRIRGFMKISFPDFRILAFGMVCVTFLGMTWLLTNPSSSIRIKSGLLEIELKSNETVRLENQRSLPK